MRFDAALVCTCNPSESDVIWDSHVPGTSPATPWRVVFTDWEAMSVLPVMWDFMYATLLGQSVSARKEHLDAQLNRFANSRALARITSAGSLGFETRVPVAATETHVMSLSLRRYLSTLQRLGVPADDVNPAACMLEVHLLTLVLVYYCQMLNDLVGVEVQVHVAAADPWVWRTSL